MKVLVLGATGFIGNPICLALLKEGHTVIGQTRSAESARKLEADEIYPLVADPSDPSQWRQRISQVDAVIDCIGGENISTLCTTVLNTVVEEAKKSRPQGPPLSFIYTGGTWVHGNTRDENSPAYGSNSDRTPITHPMKLTKWRIPHEQAVLGAQSKSFAPNVIRPSLLYGRSGSITSMWFADAKKGEVKFTGDKEARIATIHADDLARAFVLCIEKSYVVQGVIFDVSNPYPEPIAHILGQLAKISGAKGPTYVKPSNDFEEAVGSTNVLRPTLARSLLGWEPRRPPFAEEMEVYYRAWLASQASSP